MLFILFFVNDFFFFFAKKLAKTKVDKMILVNKLFFMFLLTYKSKLHITRHFRIHISIYVNPIVVFFLRCKTNYNFHLLKMKCHHFFLFTDVNVTIHYEALWHLYPIKHCFHFCLQVIISIFLKIGRSFAFMKDSITTSFLMTF